MELEICSFCKKGAAEGLRQLCAAGDVAICTKCVVLCHDYLFKPLPSVSYDISAMENITPLSIKKELDKKVIGQESAKRILAVATYNHYKRVKFKEKNLSLSKNNVLLLGPTGSGKTLLAHTLAKILKVPFGSCDATTITETGYVGASVESALTAMLKDAKSNVDKAAYGIVYVDEIDKLSNNHTDYRVSGTGSQRGFLKLIEGTIADVPVGNKETIPLKTDNILFIFGGAFPDLEKIIDKRINKSTSMGFGGVVDKQTHENILQNVSPKDLVTYGFMAEFIGRIPVLACLNALTASDLVAILTEPEDALISQYKSLFALDGTTLNFTSESLEMIANRALRNKTGARGLRAILEHVLLDSMYEVPTTQIKVIDITQDVVEERFKTLKESYE